MILDVRAESFDAMELAGRLKSDEATRRLPILAILDARDRERLARALDLGVNDVVAAPTDGQELNTRVRALVRRKRYADYLRASLDHGQRLAAADQLTGLRRRDDPTAQLSGLVERCRADGAPLSVVLANVDHIKLINDTYGHEVGDSALREVAARLSSCARAGDLVTRSRAADFLVVMPGADVDAARSLAERVRRAVGDVPVHARPDLDISVTASLGVSRLEPGDDAARLLRRADHALDAAKQRGRNRVVVAHLKRPDEAA